MREKDQGYWIASKKNQEVDREFNNEKSKETKRMERENIMEK